MSKPWVAVTVDNVHIFRMVEVNSTAGFVYNNSLVSELLYMLHEGDGWCLIVQQW